jgi:hemerythrin-like domain-containing protein
MAGKAIQDLMREHGTITHVLKIMEQIISPDNRLETNVKLEYTEEIINFLKIFVDKCHHGKEEEYLFKELEKNGVPNQGGPIGVMLQEHQLGRQYIGFMTESLTSNDVKNFDSWGVKYINLLKVHIKKENEVLFVIADRILTEAVQNDLFTKFEQHEESVIGHGIHDKLDTMINKLSRELGVQ